MVASRSPDQGRSQDATGIRRKPAVVHLVRVADPRSSGSLSTSSASRWRRRRRPACWRSASADQTVTRAPRTKRFRTAAVKRPFRVASPGGRRPPAHCRGRPELSAGGAGGGPPAGRCSVGRPGAGSRRSGRRQGEVGGRRPTSPRQEVQSDRAHGSSQPWASVGVTGSSYTQHGKQHRDYGPVSAHLIGASVTEIG
jgi:hypothetical protein